MGTQTRRRGDTRGDIQRAALTRFTDQGYDATSLREIAEDLGVTKAAVYYHFRSKEEILSTSLEQLMEWARAEPSSREHRLELLRRLGDATQGGLGDLMRCVQRNEIALAGMPGTVDVVKSYKHQLWTVAMPPDATIEDRLRVRLAIMAVLLANHGSSDLGGTEAERQAAAQRIGADLMP